MHEVRNGLVTASASLSSGTAATLLAGDTGNLLDLVEVTLSSNSTITSSVVLKNDGTTVRTFQVPTNGSVSIAYDVPVKQLTKNTPWLVDMEDVTGTTVTIDAVFIKK